MKVKKRVGVKSKFTTSNALVRAKQKQAMAKFDAIESTAQLKVLNSSLLNAGIATPSIAISEANLRAQIAVKRKVITNKSILENKKAKIESIEHAKEQEKVAKNETLRLKQNSVNSLKDRLIQQKEKEVESLESNLLLPKFSEFVEETQENAKVASALVASKNVHSEIHDTKLKIKRKKKEGVEARERAAGTAMVVATPLSTDTFGEFLLKKKREGISSQIADILNKAKDRILTKKEAEKVEELSENVELSDSMEKAVMSALRKFHKKQKHKVEGAGKAGVDYAANLITRKVKSVAGTVANIAGTMVPVGKVFDAWQFAHNKVGDFSSTKYGKFIDKRLSNPNRSDISRAAWHSIDNALRTFGNTVKTLPTTIKNALMNLPSLLFKGIAKTLGGMFKGITKLGSFAFSKIRGALSFLGSSSGLQDLAAMALLWPTFISPLISTIKKQLEDTYGEHWISDFLSKTWYSGMDFLVDKVRDAFGLSSLADAKKNDLNDLYERVSTKPLRKGAGGTVDMQNAVRDYEEYSGEKAAGNTLKEKYNYILEKAKQSTWKPGKAGGVEEPLRNPLGYTDTVPSTDLDSTLPTSLTGDVTKGPLNPSSFFSDLFSKGTVKGGGKGLIGNSKYPVLNVSPPGTAPVPLVKTAPESLQPSTPGSVPVSSYTSSTPPSLNVYPSGVATVPVNKVMAQPMSGAGGVGATGDMNSMNPELMTSPIAPLEKQQYSAKPLTAGGIKTFDCSPEYHMLNACLIGQHL